MTLTEYNGWTNKATWLVFTWLTNSESHLDAVRDELDNAPDDPAGALCDYTRDMLVSGGDWTRAPSGLRDDLVTWAISFVDWHAVADGIAEL